MTIETRSVSAHSVKTEDKAGVHYVTLRAIRPHVVDAYGSLWNPHCFDASLARRLPTLLWQHNRDEPIGRAVSYAASSDGPLIKFRFDDFDDVPRARQAWRQCKPGADGAPATIDDCSVGFSNATRRSPSASERERYPGIVEVIEEADLDEVSLVILGAVPGAKVETVRFPVAAREPSVTELRAYHEERRQRLRLLDDAARGDFGRPRRALSYRDERSIDEALAETDAALDDLLYRR